MYYQLSRTKAHSKVMLNESNSPHPCRGAFCEAKVRSVVKQVKVRVAFRGSGNGTALLSSEYVRLVGKAASVAEGAAAGAAAAAGDVLAQLTVGAVVQARHPDKQEYLDATVRNKMNEQGIFAELSSFPFVVKYPTIIHISFTPIST